MLLEWRQLEKSDGLECHSVTHRYGLGTRQTPGGNRATSIYSLSPHWLETPPVPGSFQNARLVEGRAKEP